MCCDIMNADRELSRLTLYRSLSKKNCRKKSEQSLDEMEFLNVKRLTAAEIEQMISDGEFKQAMHVMAWLLALRQ